MGINRSKFLDNKAVRHFSFWLVYILFYGTIYGAYDENFADAYLKELIYIPVKMVITYFVLYYLLPKFLLTGRYLRFALLFVASSFLAAVAYRYCTFYIEYPIFYPAGQNYPLFYPIKIIKGLVGIYPVVFFAVSFKMLRYWYESRQAQQELAQEKLASELKFLKTQIHPHFLFNTLNNLYALTLKKSDAAPQMVLKISDLINYMLYECNVECISVEKEIQFIRNYVEVEKMRFGNLLDFNLNIQGSIDQKKIPPLILLPFFENAFKHGVSEELEQSWVTGTITIDSRFQLKLENSKAEEAAHANGNNGIGLANVKRRLDLLYDDTYQLQIFDEEETYLIVLSIPLTEDE